MTRGFGRDAFHRWWASLAAWRFLLGYCETRAWPIAAVVGLGCVQALAALPTLYVMRYAFNEAIPAGWIAPLVTTGLALLGIKLAFSGLALLGRSLTLRLTKGIIGDVRRDLLAALYRFPMDRLGRDDAARTQTRVVQDTERVDILLGLVISAVLPAVLASVMLVAILVSLNAWLVLLLAGLAPFVWGGTLLAGRLVKRATRLFQGDFERFSQGVHFVLRQMDLTRTRGFVAAELRQQGARVDALERSGIRMAMSHAVNAQLQSTLAGLAGFVLLVGGGIAIIGQAMSLGDLLAFYLAAGLLNGHAATIAGAIPEIIGGGQSLGKLAALRGEAAVPLYRGRQVPVFHQALGLSAVTFGFGDDVLLQDVSIELAPGSVTVVFGANGAGKSTLVGLILGFHRPWSGQLSLDGVPYDAIDMAALRRQVGVVPQRPGFFPGSIADNIGYGRPDTGPAALNQAIDLAGARPFIDGLDEGLEAPLGEGGTLVSGGEAQKLAIARALVGQPGLLILDEPTNHLDAASIAALMRKLAALPGGPAVLIISHNIQAAQFADRIFQLRDRRLHRVPDAARLESQNESLDA